MMSKTRRVAVGGAALLVAAAGFATTRYVSGGADNAASVAAATIQPGQSWDAVFDQASPGDVYDLAAGDHGTQELTGNRGGQVTFRAADGANVTLEKLSLGGATHVRVENVGEFARTRITVGRNPIAPVHVELVNVKGISAFLRAEDIRWVGGELGGFDGCAFPELQDGLRVWNDGTRGSRRVYLEDIHIHDVRRSDCSAHVDGMMIWGASDVTLKNMRLTNMPTLGIIVRPVGGGKIPTHNITIDGGHYGPVLDGTQPIDIGSNGEDCRNILVTGVTTSNQVSTFDCVSSVDGSLPRVENSTLRVGDCASAVFTGNTYLPGSAVCSDDVPPPPTTTTVPTTTEEEPPPPPPYEPACAPTCDEQIELLTAERNAAQTETTRLNAILDAVAQALEGR